MEIVLLILKIIGITLLVLLGVILLLVLLVLFFPISYRISASYNEVINARVKVHWLFHLISVTLDYGEGVRSCILRLFGIPLTDFLNPKPKKEKKPKKAKPESKQAELKLEDFEGVAEATIADDEADDALTEETITEEAEQIQGEKFTAEEERLSLWQRIRQIPGRIKQTIETIIQKFKDIFQKGVDIKAKIDQWVELLGRERTKVALGKGKNHIVRLLKHIMPRKWNAYVEMGFDDPATTGRILGYYWMFIGLWGDHFICVPDFEKKVLTANIDAKGSIQIFKFVYVVFQFLFDKDLVYLRKEISKANSQ